MNRLFLFFLPNADVTPRERLLLAFIWAVSGLGLWQIWGHMPLFPRPTDILSALGHLGEQGIYPELGTSIWTMFQAIFFWTLPISLTLAYLSVIPVFRPIAKFLVGLRYFGLVGLTLPFTMLAGSGHSLKIMLLTFGISVFYLKDMLSVVQSIPQAEYDHAETLGMSKFRIMYEVVILGTMGNAIESLRNNAAMGWVMLTMVEGIVRSEGGIGVVLINQNRHMDLAAIGAILLLLYGVGKIQDAALWFANTFIIAPYAAIGKR